MKLNSNNNETSIIEQNKDMKKESSLKDELITKIIEAIIFIEKNYEMPIDIEFGIEKNILYILQARPITTYNKIPDILLTKPKERRQLYFDLTIGLQGFEKPMTTLGADFFKIFEHYAGIKMFDSYNFDDVRKSGFDAFGGKLIVNLSNVMTKVSKETLVNVTSNVNKVISETLTKYWDDYKNDNYYDSKMINLDSINKHSNKLLNINFNNRNNSEKVYINSKFLTRLNENPKYNLNYNNELNPIYKSKDISEEENSINETKEGNFNLEEDNFEPGFINNNFSLGNNNTPKFTNFNKKLFNNFSRNENSSRLIPNPQYFHPSFHPNISFQYISILQIQYPIQMTVKKSKKLQLVKHKLIKYYPPKIQLEMRPCLIFQPLMLKKKKKQHKKIPNNKKSNHKKIKHKRPVFKIPPCKKASLSQGKSLNFIHKYYDENFILEEENEEENKALKDMFLTHKQTEVQVDLNKDNDENIININEKDKEKPDVKEEKINKVIIAVKIQINEFNLIYF